MADVDNEEGVRLVLKVGNGASPEVFETLCTINAERGITFNGESNDQTIPDCADPSKIAWVARTIRSLSVAFNGAGMLHRPDVPKMDAWWRSGASKNCKLILDAEDPDDAIVWNGKFKLPTFQLNGNAGAKATASLSVASDGEVTLAP